MIRACILLIVSFILSCENPYEVQNEYLLPCEIDLRSKEEIGITTIRIYSYHEQDMLDSLSFFPINMFEKEKKEVVSWHLPTEREWDDLMTFFNYEQRGTKISQKIQNWFNSQNLMVAYIYDQGKHPVGSSEYEVTDWSEYYFLNLQERELIHMSYGKF